MLECSCRVIHLNLSISQKCSWKTEQLLFWSKIYTMPSVPYLQYLFQDGTHLTWLNVSVFKILILFFFSEAKIKPLASFWEQKTWTLLGCVCYVDPGSGLHTAFHDRMTQPWGLVSSSAQEALSQLLTPDHLSNSGSTSLVQLSNLSASLNLYMY